MDRAARWTEDTASREIADFLPRSRHERWIDLGFGLLVAILLLGWSALPDPAARPQPPTGQSSPR
ncbi:hypothetical protein [Bosea sp. PAMC 26642]|uniref:hypothetical protein n=1 Tax=Bosea sp. (strain PAMC 26642) TaxID=1792307 RepID=UPI0012E98587|nr:hypothetical protein [Bosea sp. PAMC 26642]